MNRQYEHFDTDRLNAIPITEVARRLGCQLQRSGTVVKTLCPWHEDKRPSLTLYERTGENHCHCFSCGKGGSVISFTMQHEEWSFQEACRWLSGEFGISTMPAGAFVPRPKQKPAAKPVEPDYTYIPVEMVDELVTAENSLSKCLMRMFQPEKVEWVTEEYRIGACAMGGHDDCTVFPNIDIHGRVCNLKVQHYDTDPSSPRFAHSDKGSCYWLGSVWARQGRLPKDARFRSKCLFGEHLLARYPESMVVLVESPKNALFGALAFPLWTWVATGSKGMLRREVLQPLQGRDVIVIPDRDAIADWSAAIAKMADLANFTVFDICQQKAPEGDLKFDIADYIQMQHPVPF
jgi:hypothetical protein